MPCFLYKSEGFSHVLCAQFEVEMFGSSRKNSEYNGSNGIVQCLNVKIFYHAYHISFRSIFFLKTLANWIVPSQMLCGCFI